MSNLLLHCGAEAMNREDLTELPLPEAQGPRHKPTPFAEFVDVVEEQLREIGLSLNDQAYGATPDGNKFFGLMEVGDPRTDFALTVGLRGSQNQTLARSLAVGSRVFVCDNLAFSGDIRVSTRQTTHMAQRLPKLVASATAQIPRMVETQDRRFDAYRNAGIQPNDGDHLLVEMVRRDILPPSKLGLALREWDEPRHEEHAEQGHSAWRLYNAVTEAIKPPPTSRQANAPGAMNRTQKLTHLIDNELGLVLEAEAA